MQVNPSFAILVTAVVLSGSDDLAAGMKGDRELLKLAAATHQANRDRVETWKGRAKVFLSQEPEGREVHSTVEFVYDAARDALRWKWTYDRFVNPFDHDHAGDVESILLRDGKYHKLSVAYDSNRRVVDRWISVGPAQIFRGRHHAKGFFYPMRHLNYPGTEHAWHRIFTNYYNGFNHPRANGAVERQDDRLTLELSAPNVSQHFRFDLARGANLTECRSAESHQVDEYKATWEEVDGIWLPKTWSFNHAITRDYEFGKRGQSFHRSVEWISSDSSSNFD